MANGQNLTDLQRQIESGCLNMVSMLSAQLQAQAEEAQKGEWPKTQQDQEELALLLEKVASLLQQLAGMAWGE